MVYCLRNNYSLKNFPPPNFSDSFSFNKKIEFSHDRKSKILAVGSSMALINLESSSVKKHLKSAFYTNLSSWGLSIKDMFRLIKIYQLKYDFTTLVMSSNMCDFSANEKSFSSREIVKYLESRYKNWYNFYNIDLKYLFTNFSIANESIRDNIHYESLRMDTDGGVLLDGNNFEKRKQRWNNDDIGIVKEYQYDYLDSINQFCKKKNIKFYFFQSPLRKGLINSQNKGAINTHVKKCKKILSNSVYFVNSVDTIWSDNLFVDGTHFNKKGAYEYTNYCFQQLEKNE
jgi:hypothetical protein